MDWLPCMAVAAGLLLAAALIGRARWRELGQGLQEGLREFRAACGALRAAFFGPANAAKTRSEPLLLSERLVVWLAEGFGLGRAPVLPGTVGTLLGLPWTAALLATGAPWGYALGTLLGLAVSVWAAGAAERVLGRHDPGSVVIDEITALPVAFLGAVLPAWWHAGAWPEAGELFRGLGGWLPVLVFAAFRVFDILKPWPVNAAQHLPGGWGVTADDVVAAGYAAIVVWLVLRFA
jgi:phosphatidylglycerophosphatase A